MTSDVTTDPPRKKVHVAPYDPAWPTQFAAEKARLEAALGGVPATIEHIGSTSVPGLAAKPVIDILAGRPDNSPLDAYVAAFTGVGYEYRGEYGLPGRHYFVRGDGGAHTHHLHLVVHESDFWRRHLAFRDHLRRSPESAAAYARLKHELAARFAGDKAAYTEAKGPFIAGILRELLGEGGGGR